MLPRLSWSVMVMACSPDSMGVVEGDFSDEELATITANLDSSSMLQFLNGPAATVAVLDLDVGLDSRAALNIVAHVRGADGVLGTSDDDLLGSLAELDAIPYVGSAAMDAINRFVTSRVATSMATSASSTTTTTTGANGVRVIRAATVASLSSAKPAPGTYRVHMIDVGTGLAILVQGTDFNLLFDGGSTDDSAGISATGNKSRLLAYLSAAIGLSADPACRPSGDTWPAAPGSSPEIDHVFLSHPHQDHSNMLDEVLRCYQVKNVWDSGARNDSSSYATFLSAVAAEPGVNYRTHAAPPANRQMTVWAQNITFPSSASWSTFQAGDRRTLGAGATFTVLFADGAYYANQFNDNSTVLRLDLGSTSVLLTGDAEAGPRDSLLAPVGEIEGALLKDQRAALDVDILQVAHHGSKTSSRKPFLDAVSPRYALVSAGPTLNNGGVSFPDSEVIDGLKATGAQVLRTDEHDARCPEVDRIGVDDTKPGGCDSYLLELSAR